MARTRRSLISASPIERKDSIILYFPARWGWFSERCSGRGAGGAIRSRSIPAEILSIWALGIWAVVREGEATSASGLPSKPVTITFLGTQIPFLVRGVSFICGRTDYAQRASQSCSYSSTRFLKNSSAS